MERPLEQQILKIFQSLFSKEQLRKNLYLYQHLNPDMTMRTKVIYQERKVCALSKDYTFLLKCLQKCPLVKILDKQTVHILMSGDSLLVHIWSPQKQKQIITLGQIRKLIHPALKDIKYQIREIKKQLKSDAILQVQFQSQTAVNQFIQRIKNRNINVGWALKQKDPYDCIKKSIKYLLKQRKNQQQQGNSYTGYSQQQQYFDQGYQNNTNMNANNYGYGNYSNSYSNGYNSNGYGGGYGGYSNSHYQTFIRKAVDSEQQHHQEQEQKQHKNKGKVQYNTKIQQHKQESQDKDSKQLKDQYNHINSNTNGNSNGHSNGQNNKRQLKHAHNHNNNNGKHRKQDTKKQNTTKVQVDTNDFPSL